METMSFIKFWKSFFSFALFPRLYIGGGSHSQNSTASSTSTSNNVNNIDKRLVTSGNGVAASGNGNTQISNTTNTVTDFGSVSKALDGMTQTASAAIDLGQFGINGAIAAMMKSSDNQLAMSQSVIDAAKQSSANALTTSQQVIGMATAANSTIAGAYANQADTANGNKKIMYVALGIMGLVAVKMFSGKAA